MIKDLVSIVIPTYNDEKHLTKALDDMVNQTYRPIEIIIVDDGSTDDTPNILAYYESQYDFIKVYTKEHGNIAGPGAALNYGHKFAQGEFQTWVSSDDRKFPHMIETLVNFLKKNRDIELVVSAFISDYLKGIWRSVTPSNKYPKGYEIQTCPVFENGTKLSKEEFFVDEWTSINESACHMGVNYMYTKKLKDKCGEYLLIPGEDYYMEVLMSLNSRVGYIDEVLGTHKCPEDALSVMNRSCVAEANVLTRQLINHNYIHWHLSKIPKVANFYWGSEKMSFLRYMTIHSFKTLNPDWSVKIYVPKNFVKEKLWEDKFHQSDTVDYHQEYDYFDKLKKDFAVKIIEVDIDTKQFGETLSEAQKSDYFRWALLYQSGGFWFDMDIVFIKPMSKIYFNDKINNVVDTVVCIDPNHGNFIGVLSSHGNKNPYYRSLIEMCKTKEMVNEYQSLGAPMINTKYHNIEIIRNFFKNLRVINLDTSTFYFYNFLNLHKIYDQNNYELLPNNAIGVHWYGGHPVSQKWNNTLNHKNYKRYDNTLISAIKETYNDII
ncbi:glycosyltransferase [Candidatus Pacearchaeota archaeon]|jgi:glycosyltransferase involved in cell wall biosynthesis|nr:glycosyltransferase [Candidatus Pacearchaeota archaeon]